MYIWEKKSYTTIVSHYHSIINNPIYLICRGCCTKDEACWETIPIQRSCFRIRGNNTLTRSIVTHEDVTTRLLLICLKPMSMWTHMIRTTWVQYPLFRVLLYLFNHNMEKLEYWKKALHQVANLSGFHFKHGYHTLPIFYFIIFVGLGVDCLMIWL